MHGVAPIVANPLPESVEQADLLTAEAQPLASPLLRAPIKTVERNPSGKEEGVSGLPAVTDD